MAAREFCSALNGKNAVILCLRWAVLDSCASIKETNVTNEEDILVALDKPRAIYSLQQRLDPSSKTTDALQNQLMIMRAKGVVKFDINTGKWSKS